MRTLSMLLIAIFLYGCNKPVAPIEKAIRPIMWTEVSISSLEQVRTLSGIIAPVEATNLSFEVSGKVQSVNASLGNEVKKGDELARLNQRSFNLSLRSAQAQYEQSKVSFIDAKNEYLRYEKLIAQGLISQSGYDNAKAAFESSKSVVDINKAQLDIATKNLQDSILTAPYDGIITKRIIEPSQQINAGQSVFEIEGKHGLEVRMMVPETLIQELKQDAILPVRFPVLSNIEMLGQITEIGTRAETANAFPVTVVLQEDNNQLRAGMTAEVEFSFQGIGRTGHQGPSIKVPVSALSAGLDQKAYVFVYNPKRAIVERKQVQTENILNNEVFISSGLNSGDIIATAGVAFLSDGQKVTLLDKHTQRFN